MCHNLDMDTDFAPLRCLPVAYTPSASTEEVEDIALLLKTLGEPMRLTILEIVAAARGAEVCACVFPDALGVSQPTASHHLRKLLEVAGNEAKQLGDELLEVGLLQREQRGKWAYFRLVPDGYERVRAFLDPLLSHEMSARS